ncbi:MAG: hypothetical protein ACR2QC_09815 [Gammaproteobacteria bacterium]
MRIFFEGEFFAESSLNMPFPRSPPSHSCEGRNLHAEGGNCTISRRFAAAEIPAIRRNGTVSFP